VRRDDRAAVGGIPIGWPEPARHFRVRCNRDDQLAVDGFSRHALALLEADPWPGNVRELEAVVRRAIAVRRRGWWGRRT
jgi:DNA-binding NtrC family response regulator